MEMIPLPNNAVTFIQIKFKMHSGFIKRKTRKKYTHVYETLDRKSGGSIDNIKALQLWADGVFDTKVAQSPMGKRSFDEGRYHLRTEDNHAEQELFFTAWEA